MLVLLILKIATPLIGLVFLIAGALDSFTTTKIVLGIAGILGYPFFNWCEKVTAAELRRR